jgi:hypothetical protein
LFLMYLMYSKENCKEKWNISMPEKTALYCTDV